MEQTDDVSPGSPLSVPLSCPSLSSESRQCNDKSLGPSDEDAGDGGERCPLCPARISVIMNLDLLRWWCGMVVATAADISCIVMGGPGLGPADSPLDKVTPANVKRNRFVLVLQQISDHRLQATVSIPLSSLSARRLGSIINF